MKNQSESSAIKLIENFDKQLQAILAEELQLIRAAKNKIMDTLSINSSETLAVA